MIGRVDAGRTCPSGWKIVRIQMEAGRMEKSPDAFRTISEVAEDLDLPQHVLRFWETRFSQIKPMKRGGGRRYYRPEDIDLLRGIRHLLYDQGYTIKGVQKLLKQNGPRFAISIGSGEISAAEALSAFENTSKSPEPAETTKPEPPAVDDDRLVGEAKVPRSKGFMGFGSSSRKEAGAETGEATPSSEDRALLQEALYELLECKRILDQTR
jgi:DNA-binding transcriptional MerR regulator